MKNVIYLASGRARISSNGLNILYNDLFEKNVDYKCDMMSVDLSLFDILIASPPCNYYSRANSYKSKETSVYAQSTKHLLPDIIDKFIKTGKPFIVENVRSYPLFSKLGLFDKNCFVYFHGRHTYWTNIPFNPQSIPQIFEFRMGGKGHEERLCSYVQGGKNVNDVFEYWLNCVVDKYVKAV